jgi:uncharacterized repeat protein (TIGR01451 family)
MKRLASWRELGRARVLTSVALGIAAASAFAMIALTGSDRTAAIGPSPAGCTGAGSGAQITLYHDLNGNGTIDPTDGSAVSSGAALVPGAQLLFRVRVNNTGTDTCDAKSVHVWARLPEPNPTASFVEVCEIPTIEGGSGFSSVSYTCDAGAGGTLAPGTVLIAPNGVVPYKVDPADRDKTNRQYLANVVGRGDTLTFNKCILTDVQKNPNLTPVDPRCYGSENNNDWAWAEVTVQKTAKQAKITNGDPAVYNILVSAIGKRNSTNVTLTDLLPNGGTASGDCVDTVPPGGTLTCNFGPMGPTFLPTTRNVTLTVPTTSADCPSISNTATVSSSNDTDLTNNSSTVAVAVNCPDVHVKKSADHAKVTISPTASAPLTYTITAQNAGPGPAHHVTVTDDLADRLAIKTVESSQGGCTSGTGNTLSCDLGDVAAGGSATVTIFVNVPAGNDCSPLTNQARVTASNEDPTQIGDNSSAIVTVLVNGCGNPPIKKVPHIGNLWLCQPVATCADPAAGIGERDFNVELNAPITSIEPKCPDVPTPAPSGPAVCPAQRIGSFEFEIRYDSKLVSVTVEPGPIFQRADALCTSTPTQHAVQFRCNIKGKPVDAASGPGVLAIVRVRATSDVYSMLMAEQDNGIVTQLNNQDCQLSDLQGHPIKTALCSDAWVTIRYLEGDLNADCEVDVRDQQEIAFRWGSVLGMLMYNSRFDLEPSAPKRGDSDIDAKDLQVVFGRHGSTCADPHPAQPPIDPSGGG